MLRQLSRLPLRTCLQNAGRRSINTNTPPSFARWDRLLTVGPIATLAASGYIYWRLSDEERVIKLDSRAHASIQQQPTEAYSSTSASSSKVHSVEVADSDKPHPSPETSEVEEESARDNNTGGEGDGAGGAFNPVTGEINWDCPCLGGMAHGPCGPEFKEAFSCFVFSEEEPKGINCVEKFKNMQDCFRAHPDVYADEIMDDDDEEPELEASDTSGEQADLPPLKSKKSKEKLSVSEPAFDETSTETSNSP